MDRFHQKSGKMSQDEIREESLLATALDHVARFNMHPWGMHGVAHWWRVRHNGLLLAPSTGADAKVVRMFAIFHDSHRQDNHADPMHGPRAAQWIERVRLSAGSEHRSADLPDDSFTRAAIVALSDAQFAQLHTACTLHTSAIHHDDPTIATCFAADRLDLGRVGTRPNPKYIPIDRAILTDTVIEEAIARTNSALNWTDAAEFTRTWGLVIPDRHE
jgi:uncharacterized protein